MLSRPVAMPVAVAGSAGAASHSAAQRAGSLGM
jgi:hypothetical protein